MVKQQILSEKCELLALKFLSRFIRRFIRSIFNEFIRNVLHTGMAERPIGISIHGIPWWETEIEIPLKVFFFTLSKWICWVWWVEYMKNLVYAEPCMRVWDSEKWASTRSNNGFYKIVKEESEREQGEKRKIFSIKMQFWMICSNRWWIFGFH